MAGRHDRHGFLGQRSEEIINTVRPAVVGINGGGSHLVQQFAHIGFRRLAGFDYGRVDTESNLTRNVLATIGDYERQELKTNLAGRKLASIVGGQLDIEIHACRWQDRPEVLATSDVVLGAVDTFKERNELEAFARRYMIPYIDIGMDVNTVGDDPPRMAGQVILSMPGEPCMWCLGFLTKERLSKEAQKYGDVGGRPQVVWANGMLASAAVGLTMDLLCDWTRRLRSVVHHSYDGNTGLMSEHSSLKHLSFAPCPHYPLSEVGPPRFAVL